MNLTPATAIRSVWRRTLKPKLPAKRMAKRKAPAVTELQWISRLGADLIRRGSTGDEWAVASSELGGRDWEQIDPQPVRMSLGVANHHTPALYFWQRTREHVWCESQEERWQLLWLDYGGQVDRIWSQPMRINFGRETRLFGRHHFPDHFAQLVNGDYALFDIKHPDQIDEEAELQFSETAEICRRLGWHYKVLAGHDTRATRNLNCLSSSRHDRCKPTEAVEALILETAREGRSREELCRIASPDAPPIACAWVDNLAWRRLLDVDLRASFSSSTIYKTSKLGLQSAE